MTNLKKAIEASGLKQNWIAAKLGIDYTMLSRYVTGDRECPQDLLERLAALLRVDVGEIE